MSKLFCDVYKGTKREGLYIYVNRVEGLGRVPDELLAKFGEASVALSFELTSRPALAKEDPKKVIEAIETNGYFLQLPPHETSI